MVQRIAGQKDLLILRIGQILEKTQINKMKGELL